MTRVGIITQARTTSTRLPGKVLLNVAGKTILDHHLDRLAAAGLPVLVATTTNSTDDEIAAMAEVRGLSLYRGSETDVLSRFRECAVTFGLDAVVRVTSDCPLIDGRLIASAVSEYIRLNDPWLYLSNTLERTFPRGFDFEVFSTAALTVAHEHATELEQREHVTPYMYAGSNKHMNVRAVLWSADRSTYRITLDTPDDLDLIRALIEGHHAHRLSCAQIIALLDAHPELAAMNNHVEQKRLGE